MTTCWIYSHNDAKNMFNIIIVCCSLSIFISLVFLPLFIKNLYCTNYNWVQRQLSLKIKVLTIAMPSIHFLAMTLVLIYTMIAKCDNDWGRSNIDHHAPTNNHTMLKDKIEYIFIILIGINWPLYSYFILETIYTYFSNNPSMNTTLQKSCCFKYVYCWMVILILMEPVILLTCILLDALMFDPYSYFATKSNDIEILFICSAIIYFIW